MKISIDIKDDIFISHLVEIKQLNNLYTVDNSSDANTRRSDSGHHCLSLLAIQQETLRWYHGYDDMIDITTMTEDIEDPNFAIPASIDALASSRVRPSPFTVLTDKIGMFSSKFHGGFQLFSIILVEWDIIENVRQYLAAFWVLCNLNLRHDHPHQFPPDSS